MVYLFPTSEMKMRTRSESRRGSSQGQGQGQRQQRQGGNQSHQKEKPKSQVELRKVEKKAEVKLTQSKAKVDPAQGQDHVNGEDETFLATLPNSIPCQICKKNFKKGEFVAHLTDNHKTNLKYYKSAYLKVGVTTPNPKPSPDTNIKRPNRRRTCSKTMTSLNNNVQRDDPDEKAKIAPEEDDSGFVNWMASVKDEGEKCQMEPLTTCLICANKQKPKASGPLPRFQLHQIEEHVKTAHKAMMGNYYKVNYSLQGPSYNFLYYPQ